MIESLIIKCSEDERYMEDLKKDLNSMSIQSLFKIFNMYSSSSYLIRYKNIDKVLYMMTEIIASKLDSVSLINVINIYADNYIRILEDTEQVTADSNLVNIRSLNLGDDEFFAREARNRNVDRDNFFNDYVSGISSSKKRLESYDLIFKIMDNLQEKIYNYIIEKFKKLSDIEKNKLVEDLDKIISENEVEINRRKELISDKNKIKLLSMYLKIPLFDMYDRLNPKKIETITADVYKSFREILKEYTNRRPAL